MRSRLTTGMPARIALSPTWVSALPSAGSTTRTSTFLLMRVSIWPIWAAVSFEPSVISRVTSEYFLARLLALSLIALSQPWSACGPAKPMVTCLPGLVSAPVWSFAAGFSSLLSLLVQPARKAVAETAAVPKRRPLRLVACDMALPVVGDMAPLVECDPVLALSSGRAGVRPALHQYGRHDDRPLGDLLDVALQVVQGEDVGDRREDQDSEHGAGDGAASPAEQRAADDRGRDGVEFVGVAVGVLAGAGQDDQQEGGDAAAQPGEQIQIQALAAYVDAGEPGGFRVAADGDRAAAEGGAVEDEPADDRHDREDDDERRDAEHVRVAFAQVEDAADGDDLGLAVGDLQGEAAGRGQHGERGDERDHAAVGDEQAVDQAASDADDHGGEQDAREAVVLGGHRRRPHGGQGDDRADRQVDAAGGDDEGHADGDDTDHRGLGEDELEVAGVEELVGLGDPADEDQRGEDAQEGEGADVGTGQQAAPGRGLAGRRHLVGVVPWRGGMPRHDAGLPSMTRSSTRCSSSSRA